ncbi:MAG: Gx transporter family protein [Oscillospiraceae bacterium]
MQRIDFVAKNGNKTNVYKIAFMGLLFSLAIVLSYIEGLLPVMPQGIKLGLSNIITMYALFFMGKSSAYTIAVLKSSFVLLTRGPIAALMSLSGGIFSVTIMILLLMMKKFKPSYLIISIFGAIFHNIGQLLMAAIVINNCFVIYYSAVMVISGVVMGTVTGITLKVVLPSIKRIVDKHR